MREIKFRVWSHIAKQMYNVSALNFEENTLSDIEIAVNNSSYSVVIDQESFHTIELMQYTGYTDKNGKDIYEGDVVRIEGVEIGEVNYAFAGFRVSHNGWHRAGLDDTTPEHLEVIGNIYENPDQLKEIRAND